MRVQTLIKNTVRIFWRRKLGRESSYPFISFSKVGKGQHARETCQVSLKFLIVVRTPQNASYVLEPNAGTRLLVPCPHAAQPRHSQGWITTGCLNAVDGYPTLCCKAYNGRLMVIFLDRCIHSLASQKHGDAEIYNACVATRALTAWFDSLERAKRYLTDQEKVTLYTLGSKFVSTLEKLAILALRANVNRWRLQPKIHPMCHLNEDHLWFAYNCRYHHSYVDEDFMGLAKQLAQKCHRGDLLEFRIMCRFLLRLASWIPGVGKG